MGCALATTPLAREIISKAISNLASFDKIVMKTKYEI